MQKITYLTLLSALCMLSNTLYTSEQHNKQPESIGQQDLRNMPDNQLGAAYTVYNDLTRAPMLDQALGTAFPALNNYCNDNCDTFNYCNDLVKRRGDNETPPTGCNWQRKAQGGIAALVITACVVYYTVIKSTSHHSSEVVTPPQTGNGTEPYHQPHAQAPNVALTHFAQPQAQPTDQPAQSSNTSRKSLKRLLLGRDPNLPTARQARNQQKHQQKAQNHIFKKKR